jgi:hypothetical protein
MAGTSMGLLWRKYGAAFIVFLIMGFGYLNLDNYCSLDVTSDKASYNAGEVVELNCTITNPLPVPVYYRGYRMITTEMSYQNGSNVQRTQLTISHAWAQEAAEEARAASGEIVDSGFIMPYGEKVVKTVLYTPMREGEVKVAVIYNGFSKSISREQQLTIDKYNPREATVNSTGITLFLEKSEDADNPTILIRVRNDNPYPVIIPIFSEMETRHGSMDTKMVYSAQIFWGVSHWTIPAYSTKTVLNTNAYASDTRTPIYFTVYGHTLRYPPEP